MITKFKIFENNNGPEVGDYCLVKFNGADGKHKYFIENNIGKIINIIPDKIDVWNNVTEGDIVVGYKTLDVPDEIRRWFKWKPDVNFGFLTRNFSSDQIIEFGKTKEELERKLAQNKYNL